ncbi:hypothetical protein RF11_03359 [Thelohanellus kitauei]|uniref:Uncharacterized protein n=1 Tax=Thelohanellus kitauei TaxID=669202 RepID=A0A0C2J1C1_THEKT|nr:hypothetical protein RF11_03359 [Thelohanellus kitauei]
MKVEIYEPDTDRVWKSVYAFSGNEFIEKDSSQNQIDVIRLVPRFVEPGESIIFLILDIQPYKSLHFFEIYTRVNQCVIDDKKAYFIEKIRKEIVVSSESLCLMDIYVGDQKVAIIQRKCNNSDVDNCKGQPRQRTEL